VGEEEEFTSRFHKIPYVLILENIELTIRKHASGDTLHCLSSQFRLLTTYTCNHRPDRVEVVKYAPLVRPTVDGSAINTYLLIQLRNNLHLFPFYSKPSFVK
jgi:hypothetical protein